MNGETLSVEYRLATLQEILPLRHEVIILGTNRTSDIFPGDHDDSTLHFGAFYDDRCVACMTFMRNEWEETPAYQLRGMATHPSVRGQYVGRRALAFAEKHIVTATPIRLLWCNARIHVEEFYQKCGWITQSKPFMVEGVCMHVKMNKIFSE